MAKDLDYYLAQARKIAEHREAGAEKKIRKLYKAMLKDLQQFMSETYIQYAENDRLTYAMLQKAGYDARFLDEIEQRLNISTPAAAKQLRELVEETYTAAYEGMVHGVQKVAQGEPLEEVFAEFVAITPEQIRAAVENPISGLTLNDILEKNRRDIIYSIKREIGVGLMNGDRYTTMARRISERLDGDYKKAIWIARTECHRVREAGNHDAAISVDEALKRGTTGMRFVKVWKTMQDERVRPQRRRKGKKGWKTTMGRGANHMQLNGQTVLEDEPFDLGDGVTAMAPGQSGVAGHDVNCRCYVSRSMMTDAEFFKATGRHFSSTGLTDTDEDGIINNKEMFKRYDDARKGFKFISDKRFDQLTIEARKKGAIILRGTEEIERHLDDMEASASTIGNMLLFKKDVCVSEVLEETHHFIQNIEKMNNDKREPWRTILNEIDAREFILNNAKKYRVPRDELDLLTRQLESYKRQLEELGDD